MTDFRELLKILVQSQVEFILVGGLAAVAHGSTRLTQDVDVVYSRSEENLDRLVECLRGHAPYLRGAPRGLPFSWDRRTLAQGLNFTLETDLGDLDLLGEISGGGRYEDLIMHTVPLQVFGLEVLCLDLDTLIRVKRAAGRLRDLEVIAELEIIQEELGDTDPDR